MFELGEAHAVPPTRRGSPGRIVAEESCLRLSYLPRRAPCPVRSQGIPVSESMRLGGVVPRVAFNALSATFGATLPEPDVWVEDGCASLPAPTCLFVPQSRAVTSPPTSACPHLRSDVIVVGGLELKVLHTPGHSPGHVCYYAESVDYLFCGDLILGAGVGCAAERRVACVWVGRGEVFSGGDFMAPHF